MATKFEVGMTYAHNHSCGVTKVYIKRRTAKSVWVCIGQDRLMSTRFKVMNDDLGEYIVISKYGGFVHSRYTY